MVRAAYGNLSLVAVKGVVVLDSEGQRVLAKYYPGSASSATSLKDAKEQRIFEKALFDKTRRLNSEIILYDNHIVVYRPVVDVFVYLFGNPDENELLLHSVLVAFTEALAILFKNQVERRTVLDNMDLALLALDETIDDGIILETDASQIAARVTRRTSEADNVPIGEQSLASALKTAQEQFVRRLYT